jgi:LuxR family maltose regulon positive regulatory protein
MAEPAVPVGAGAAERDALLATKLHLPGSRRGQVPRPRLTERLDEGLAHGLVLVCAPAGYGKTALLADWARRGPARTAWLSLDSGDNDPARFWRHAVAAMDRVRPGLDARLGPLLGPPAPASLDLLVTTLINELAAGPHGAVIVLVLDDYHVIESAAVHGSVEFLLQHRSAGLHLVLASRADPPLALARLRARRQLTELRAADLRFTAGEAAGLLAQVGAGPEGGLPESAVAALTGRTEGWAAGLQLAGLSLRGQPDVAGFVAAFTGSNRYVLDFLAEEVLERQPGPVRTFLLQTSVLGRLSGELCDAVTGRTDSHVLLEQIEAAGLFLVPLDDVRGWWRYHHLFADLLRSRLQAECPGQVAQLHRTAATWTARHGLVDDAIGHAVAAGELTRAAQLIEQNFDAVHSQRGEAVTVRRWLAGLPAGLVRSRPRLLLAEAIPLATSGGLAAAQQLAEAAEAAYPGGTDEPFEPTIGRAGSLLVNVPAAIALVHGYLAQLRGDITGTAEYAAQALAQTRDGEWILRSVAQGQLGIAAWLGGHLAEAARAFADAIIGRQAAGLPTWRAWASHELSRVQQAQGRLDEVTRTCEEALEAVAAAGQAARPAAGPAHVVLADVAYQRGDLDDALRHVTEGIALCRSFVYAAPLATGLATLAWIRQAAGDPAGALAAIGEAVRAAPGPPGLANPVPAQRARLLLAQGDLAGAERWTRESGLRAGDDPDYPQESGQLVLARVLLAQGQAGPARSLLDRLHAAAVAQDRAAGMIEAGALRALALAADGDEPGAVTALADALVLACPQGYVRVFADEGPAMAALLGRLVAAQRAEDAAARRVPLGCLARLQAAFDAAPAPAGARPRAAPVVPGIVDQLTSRELEVLGRLAAGSSNRDIARDLVVSLDTVKKHVGHVLGKLGAANRTEAVARARQLGLIP